MDEVIPQLNREQAFQLFAIFCGDVERTAAALNVRPVDVLKVAEECGWLERLKHIIALKKSSKPGDIERAINRAINFCQAHRMRLFLDRAINRLTQLNEAEFQDYLYTKTTNAKTGVTTAKLSTRSLADLASALEKCHAATYAALNDTAQERIKRDKEDTTDEAAAGDLHARIAAGMAAVAKGSSPRELLFDAQVKIGQDLADAAQSPATPYDKG